MSNRCSEKKRQYGGKVPRLQQVGLRALSPPGKNKRERFIKRRREKLLKGTQRKKVGKGKLKIYELGDQAPSRGERSGKVVSKRGISWQRRGGESLSELQGEGKR